MGNHTAVILIPPLSDCGSLLKHCIQFLKEHYTEETGWSNYPSFSQIEMPFVPNILIGTFSYFHEDEFISYLQKWFNREPIFEPIYELINENEKNGKYISRLYKQVNEPREHWGVIQLIIRREHDDKFWFVNIDKDGIKHYGDIGVETM